MELQNGVPVAKGGHRKATPMVPRWQERLRERGGGGREEDGGGYKERRAGDWDNRKGREKKLYQAHRPCRRVGVRCVCGQHGWVGSVGVVVGVGVGTGLGVELITPAFGNSRTLFGP